MTHAAPNLLAFDTSTEQLSVAVQRGRDGQRFPDKREQLSNQ